MATYTQTRLGAGPDLLTTSYVEIFQVDTGNITIVKQIMVCNTNLSSTASTFSLCLTALGDGAANEPADVIFKAVSLDPGETKLINLSLVMGPSERIWGKASVAGEITITISGIVEGP